MRKVGIIGGETHIHEITQLNGKELELVGAAVRPDQVEQAQEQFDCPVFTDAMALINGGRIDLAAIANENDLKAETILAALKAGCDVVVDKPLALTMPDQERIEAALSANPGRKLLMLLTLRGQPVWAGLRETICAGRIGTPAFTHVRMAVRLKRVQRPPWFLDVKRSGGLFLDLLVHGLDQVEWLTGRRIVAVTANMGNLGYPEETDLRDHAAVYCELDDGSAAVVEGQRMLPDSKGNDYRVTVAGTRGCADLWSAEQRLVVTSPKKADDVVEILPEPVSVVEDWLAGGALVGQPASLRANRLAILATQSAETHERVVV